MVRKALVFVLASIVFLLFASPAHAQFSQQGPKLVGTGAVGSTVEQGWSVALSADGNTAIVGGVSDDNSVGAAWAWTRSGGVWTQQGPKLVGTGSAGTAYQGGAAALSADGTTAIVGGWLDNGGIGAAWIWTRSGGVWTQQGPKLVGSGAVGTSYQGGSVALSADGNTAMVGGEGDNNNAGAVWVWTRSGGVWAQQGPKLVGTGVAGKAAQCAASLSADGNTAIVGGWLDNNESGAAWVWTRSGGVWTQQGPKLVGADAAGRAQQGRSVSLSADGNTAIVGGPSDNGAAGAAWVWTRSGGAWTQQGTKLVGSGAVGSAGQGISVALSSDGNTAIVGGSSDDGTAGASWVWTRSGGVWTQKGHKLAGSDAANPASQGCSVSLSADGTTAIVGGYGDDGSTGAAWVFVATECETIALSPSSLPNGAAGAAYSQAITASGGTAPYTFAVTSGSLAPGLALDATTGILSGTPTTAGAYSFTLTATDASGCPGSRPYSLTVTGVTPPAIIGLKKVAPPFTIVVTGSNLQSGIKVYIDDVQWTSVLWKTTGKIKLTGAIKTAVPKGTTKTFRFVNPDGGEAATTWGW